jgi:tocopherol O-methyltransferase
MSFGIESVTTPSLLEDIVAYFDCKTQSILQRYGPGPRVHYHTGIVDDPPPPNASVGILRERLVAGQERMLRHAAEVWDASSQLTGQVLDVGCGLGGGAIFWAQEFGAQVTAATCVPSHADHVARFAAEAGVEQQIEPLVCDAAEVPGENRFDAAVAVDSSGYLVRRDWLDRIAWLLRPGGSVFIIDCFLEDPKYADLFNSHWHTRIGTLDEYFAAAHDSGLKTGSVVDVTDRTVHFWTTTLALIDAESVSAEGVAARRYAASFKAHRHVRDGLSDGGLCYAMLGFSKSAGKTARARPALSTVEVSS